jgi:UDP-N-acetylmuramoyl-L-alanyl-D-glutamate--2,6-diaminopimelate ligase
MKIGDTTQKNRTGNSMPGRGYIQRFLHQARESGCSYAIIEVTSQGVVLHRHRFIDWNMAVLTNLSPEHIESHGSFENYRAAKLSFLQYTLKKGGKVFLNSDDKNFDFFAEALAHANEKKIEVSAGDPWIHDRIARSAPAASIEGESAPKFFLSKFNEENIAMAAGIARELGIGEQFIETALGNFEGVPGRMEFVTARHYLGIVDYAHTPDSLEAAYQAARSLFQNDDGKLVCVLGAAGGGRDKWKRPEFGKMAAHYCDEVILTDEDPYDEDPEKIIGEIAGGIAQMPYPRPNPLIIQDRKEALAKAVDLLNDNDILIATGKGSEESIHIAGGKKIAWNEKEILQELLQRKR